MAISCILGMAGAGLVIGGRLCVGALLMLIGATGVMAATVAYGPLLLLTQPPDVRAALGAFPTNVGFYVLWLFPVPPLLVGAALLAGRRERAEEQSTA